MKIFKYFNLLISTFIFLNVFEILDLHKISEATTSFHQITSFVSDNLTEISDLKILNEFPGEIYSFGGQSGKLPKLRMDNKLRVLGRWYLLQESLVIFYTNNLNEIKSFIYFLVRHLSVRQRPKCLMMYSANSFEHNDEEMYVTDVLKNAWKNKFLDFSIMMADASNKTFNSSFYYLNPFNDIVYLRKFDQIIEIFPEKLHNAYGYPFYLRNYWWSFYASEIVRRPNGKIKINIGHQFTCFFLTKIFNLTLRELKTFKKSIHLEELNLGMLFDGMHTTKFLVPMIKSNRDIVTFVPTFVIFRRNILFSITYDFMIISFIFSTFFYTFKYFKISTGQFGIFEIVRNLLGQPMVHVPQKLILRIIIVTLNVLFCVVMNVTLSQIMSQVFSPNTYKELYDSKLPTYTNEYIIRIPVFLEYFNDPYILNVLNKSLPMADMEKCLYTLSKWKNVSCIYAPPDQEWIISKYRNPDGSPSMQVTQPPIYSGITFFYQFTDASPFALKFLETMQRIEETQLMHLPALAEKKEIFNIEKMKATSDEFNWNQLLTFFIFGSSISVVAFIIELIVYKRGILSSKYYSNIRYWILLLLVFLAQQYISFTHFIFLHYLQECIKNIQNERRKGRSENETRVR